VASGDDDDPDLTQALLRYRMIADAIHAGRGARRAILRAVAEKEHLLPDGSAMRVSLRTLERWLERYKSGKLEGLKRRPRSDRGRTRSVPQAALERVIALRNEAPERSTRTLIDIVERNGEIAPGALRRSTLDRHLDRRGASRRMLGVLGQKRHVRLQFDHPFDFVVGDFHAGPYVRLDDGTLRRSELGAFIDHCSRYVPESRYFLGEDLMAVRRGLRALCTAWAPPHWLYVDRGPGYQASRFHFACAQLEINLVHSRPYTSEGRGVIERFNRTAKEAFELEVRLRPEPPTLDELNAFWRAWLDERYHRVEHSETGEPPLARFERLLATTELRRVDPVLLDEVLRLRARRKVHPKTSTVEVGGVRFVVDTALRNRWVEVLYDPHELSSVLIYFDGRRIERAQPQIPGERPLPHPAQRLRPPQSVDYLGLLRRDHERRRAEELSHLRFAPVRDEGARLTLSRLLDLLRVCCKRPLGEVEKQHAADVLAALSPLESAIAETALRTASASLGFGLHAAQYLQALREHVLALRKKASS
jgi:transposase InsO family protein